jgi:hypothetical protein
MLSPSRLSIYAVMCIGLRVEVPCHVPLCLEDMQSDIDRCIGSAATNFVDQSCVMLHRDELEAEGRMAVHNVVRKNWLVRAKTRGEFFKITKTAIMNRMRSIVQQHRFTQKRTGIKPPDRNDHESCRSHRPHEISLDDPNAHLQIGEQTTEAEIYANELKNEIRKRLTGVTQMVFDAMLEFPDAAMKLAWLAAWRGRSTHGLRVKVTEEHIAEALEISVETYRKSVLRIQRVTTYLRDMSPEHQEYETTVQLLADVFGIQVPKSTPEMLTRRIFTIAAFDQSDKVTTEVADMLERIGAKLPKYNGTALSCYGTLFKEDDRSCRACGIRESCANQCANHGLGSVVYDSKALGGRAKRTAYVIRLASQVTNPPATSSVSDMTVSDYLQRNFLRVSNKGQTYYRACELERKRLLFCTGEHSVPFQLRFCNPSQSLRPKLLKRGKMYYSPPDIPAEQIIGLIDEHTRHAYAAND